MVRHSWHCKYSSQVLIERIMSDQLQNRLLACLKEIVKDYTLSLGLQQIVVDADNCLTYYLMLRKTVNFDGLDKLNEVVFVSVVLVLLITIKYGCNAKEK